VSNFRFPLPSPSPSFPISLRSSSKSPRDAEGRGRKKGSETHILTIQSLEEMEVANIWTLLPSENWTYPSRGKVGERG